jgi:tRNA 2-thiouridine synthesizing protein E
LQAFRLEELDMTSATGVPSELFDDDGLIRDFASWSEPLADVLAQSEGVGPLTEAHWTIIRAMREQYARRGVAPVMHRVCQQAGIERQQVNELFGYCLVAWRVSGLPNPGEEAKSYLSSM